VRPRSTSTAWRPLARLYANVTNKPTHAFRCPDGMIRYTVDNWPIQGQFLGSEDPSKERTK
jgi:hypothetical protein